MSRHPSPGTTTATPVAPTSPSARSLAKEGRGGSSVPPTELHDTERLAASTSSTETHPGAVAIDANEDAPPEAYIRNNEEKELGKSFPSNSDVHQEDLSNEDGGLLGKTFPCNPSAQPKEAVIHPEPNHPQRPAATNPDVGSLGKTFPSDTSSELKEVPAHQKPGHPQGPATTDDDEELLGKTFPSDTSGEPKDVLINPEPGHPQGPATDVPVHEEQGHPQGLAADVLINPEPGHPQGPAVNSDDGVTLGKSFPSRQASPKEALANADEIVQDSDAPMDDDADPQGDGTFEVPYAPAAPTHGHTLYRKEPSKKKRDKSPSSDTDSPPKKKTTKSKATKPSGNVQERYAQAKAGWPEFDPPLSAANVMEGLEAYKLCVVEMNQKKVKEAKLEKKEVDSSKKKKKAMSSDVWERVKDLEPQRISIEEIGAFPPSHQLYDTSIKGSIRPIREDQVVYHTNVMKQTGYN
ncbi:hypothetical protein DYB37_010714, partial [Aphanomyces astaci]